MSDNVLQGNLYGKTITYNIVADWSGLSQQECEKAKSQMKKLHYCVSRKMYFNMHEVDFVCTCDQGDHATDQECMCEEE